MEVSTKKCKHTKWLGTLECHDKRECIKQEDEYETPSSNVLKLLINSI